MSKKAFDKIRQGLTEAIAVARGEAEPARFHVPEDIDVGAVRRKAKAGGVRRFPRKGR